MIIIWFDVKIVGTQQGFFLSFLSIMILLVVFIEWKVSTKLD
jgi:hypothetical protein